MKWATVRLLALVLVGSVGCSTSGGSSSGTTTPKPGTHPPKRALAMDADADGVPDFADKCPGKKETRNGYKDDDGCPDVYPVLFGTKRIRLRQRLTFVGETAALTAASRQLLTTLASGLQKRPKIMLVDIQGHVAATGPADYSRRLSLRRAKAVRSFLVRSGGVSKLRLDVSGFGPSRPLCKDKTRACRAMNGRIELHIVWQGGKTKRKVRRSGRPGHPVLLPPSHRSSVSKSAALRLRSRRLRKLYETGLRLLKQRRFTAAYQRLRKVVRLQPSNLAARLKLGVLQARLGDHAGANETVRWVRKNVGDDAADRLRKAQLKAMADRKP